MALSEDQRALLRLLAQREQGYEDIAALKGMSVDEVRAEVRGALAAMDSPPPEPPPPPPPAPEPEPAPPVPAPEPKEPPSPAEPKGAVKASRPQRPAVPAQRRRLVLIAAGCLAAVAVVLGAIAIFGGGSDSGPSSASSEESATEIAAGGEGSVTQAVLEAADGSDAAGRAIFGRVGKKEVVLQVTAENLEPTEAGQSYTVWLYRTPKLSLRVGSVPVGETGKLGARFSIPAELLAYVASGAFDQVYVSRTSNAAYQQEVAKAKKEKSLPRYTGETVLTGEITGPIAKAGAEGG
jgi:hypothetical protein